MRHQLFITLIIALISVLLLISCNNSSIDSSLFTVEEIDGIRYVHNHASQHDDDINVKLKLLGKIGKLESELEEDILWNPVDVARLSNSDILILESDGCIIKRYNKNYEFISSFGQKGRGPGDFLSPYFLRLNKSKNKLYVAGSKISILSVDLKYEDSFIPEHIFRFGSIGVEYEKSGMAVLSDSRVVLPNHPQNWINSGEPKLLSIYDKKGTIICSFGAVKLYDYPELTVNANIVSFVTDNHDNIYVAYNYQNRICKYSPDGKMIFSADRPLPYEIKNEMIPIEMKSGNIRKEFLWPSVTSVTKGIYIDYKNRIWVLTFLKKPNKFNTFDIKENLTDCYEFDVFDSNGVLQFKVTFPNVMFDNFSIYDDRIYLIDYRSLSCVYEYRIIE